jgi:hypothetical protein
LAGWDQEDGIHLIIGSCVLRSEIRALSMPRQIPSPNDGRPVQCQLPRLLVARDCRQRHTPASAHQRASGGLCARSPFPCASRPPIGRVCVPYKPLQDSEMQRQRHLSDDQRERVFARDVASPSTLFLQKTRARVRGPGDRRNVGNGDICMIARQKDPAPGGVGGPIQPAAYSTYRSTFAARSPKIWRRPVLKISGGL